MYRKEIIETKRLIDVKSVRPLDTAAIWTAAFQLYANFGVRAGIRAALICSEFAEMGDHYHARAWDTVSGAIRELRCTNLFRWTNNE
jgi:hypothetical protein